MQVCFPRGPDKRLVISVFSNSISGLEYQNKYPDQQLGWWDSQLGEIGLVPSEYCSLLPAIAT